MGIARLVLRYPGRRTQRLALLRLSWSAGRRDAIQGASNLLHQNTLSSGAASCLDCRGKKAKVFSSSKFPTFAPFGNCLMQIRHQNPGECAELGYVCQGEN